MAADVCKDCGRGHCPFLLVPGTAWVGSSDENGERLIHYRLTVARLREQLFNASERVEEFKRLVEQRDERIAAQAEGLDRDVEIDWLVLRCPTCSRFMASERESYDPPAATLVEIQCAECNGGDFDSPSHFDVHGREVREEVADDR